MGASPGAASDAPDGAPGHLSGAAGPPRPHPEHRVYPYRLKGLAIERPNHAWCADIERHEAFLNLAVVRDHRQQPVAAG